MICRQCARRLDVLVVNEHKAASASAPERLVREEAACRVVHPPDLHDEAKNTPVASHRIASHLISGPHGRPL